MAPNVLSPVDFLSNPCWGGIKALSNLEQFRNLDRDIEVCLFGLSNSKYYIEMFAESLFCGIFVVLISQSRDYVACLPVYTFLQFSFCECRLAREIREN